MKIPKNKIALLVSILAVNALAVFCGILVMTSDSFTSNTKYSFTVLLLAIETAVIVVLFTMQEQLTQRKDNAAARKEIADQEKAVAEKETELKDKSMAVAAREQNLREQQNELVELKQLVLEAARKEDAPSELEQLRPEMRSPRKIPQQLPIHHRRGICPVWRHAHRTEGVCIQPVDAGGRDRRSALGIQPPAAGYPIP